MKRIFLLLSFLVCFFVSKAQILQKQNTYGIGFNRTGADTLIYIPSDTLSVPSWGVGKTHIARKGTTLYYWDGSKWSAISGSGGTYAAGNGLTLSGSQFKLGGTLSENTHLFGANKRLTADSLNYFDFVSRPNTYASLARIRANGSFDEGTSGVLLSSSNEDNTDSSYLKVSGTVELSSWGQDIRLKSIPTVSSTTGRKVALIDTATGKVERIDPATLVSTPTLQQVMDAGSEALVNNEIIISSLTDPVSINSVQQLALSGVSGSVQSTVTVFTDSIFITPHLGQLNIDSLRTWSGISDTLYKKPMTWDTRNGRWEYAANWPQQKINLVFGAGSGADADTTAFTTSAIYGSFYNDADTIVVTSFKAVLQGTSPDVTYKIWYNDSLNVEAGATALNTAGNQVTSTTTGTNVTSITNTKIPPGVWVWVKTSTVATKPKYFSLTVNGYRK